MSQPCRVEGSETCNHPNTAVHGTAWRFLFQYHSGDSCLPLIKQAFHLISPLPLDVLPPCIIDVNSFFFVVAVVLNFGTDIICIFFLVQVY